VALDETGLDDLSVGVVLIGSRSDAWTPIVLSGVLIDPAPRGSPDCLPLHDSARDGARGGPERPLLVGSSTLEGVIPNETVR
jgi:hypothetical protein